jgi:hypothetical protein
VLHAVHRTGRRRAFWLGFALCGCSYLVASLVPPVEARLLTTKGLAILDSKVSERVIAMNWAVTTPGGTTNTAIAVRALALSPDGTTLAANRQWAARLWNVTKGASLSGPNGTTENFVRIGHSLLALGSCPETGGEARARCPKTVRAERMRRPPRAPHRLRDMSLALVLAFLGDRLSRSLYGREGRSNPLGDSPDAARDRP